MKQQQINFSIIWGIIGVLLLGCTVPVQSKPPLQGSPTPISTQRGQKLPLTAQFTAKGQTILLEVARTAQEDEIGLMYRTSLAKDRGMLFLFTPPSYVRFWMKNTLIPLDMVFLSDGVVKYIGANIPPCQADPCPSYGPDEKIQIDRVIELPSGRAAELQLKVGDRLKIQDIQPNSLNRQQPKQLFPKQ